MGEFSFMLAMPDTHEATNSNADKYKNGVYCSNSTGVFLLKCSSNTSFLFIDHFP